MFITPFPYPHGGSRAVQLSHCFVLVFLIAVTYSPGVAQDVKATKKGTLRIKVSEKLAVKLERHAFSKTPEEDINKEIEFPFPELAEGG